ncbi:VirK family antimicrobial peptide resistance protein [soil metagenome]
MFNQRLGAKTRTKLFLGGLLYPQSSARWLDFVQRSDILGEAIHALPVAASKIYRPYLTRGLSCAARVDALIDHYAFLSRMGLGELVRQAALNDVTLAALSCKSGELARLDLSAVRDGHREGELCLKLRYRGVQIYAASLIFVLENGRPQLMIGRLQGHACPEARDLVREATRDLFGARPGALLIAVARHLAHRLGCTRVVLVSNENRIAINLWRRWHISADYDKLWAEMGATRRHDGNFEITPLAAPEVAVEALPSKKRSEARRKLAMLEALFAAMGEGLRA